MERKHDDLLNNEKAENSESADNPEEQTELPEIDDRIEKEPETFKEESELPNEESEPVKEDTLSAKEDPEADTKDLPETKNGKDEKTPVGRYILSGSIILVLLILAALTIADYFKFGVTEKMIVFNGFRYEGEFRGDNPRGKGKIVFGEDEIYESDNIGTIETDNFRIIAEMVNGIPEGKGFLLRKDGSIYAGDFKEGLMHGEGTFIWPDGSVYEGQYVNNRKEGEGKIISENGLKYIGGFKNDMMHGEGTLISPHGMEHEGVWVEGELQDES